MFRWRASRALSLACSGRSARTRWSVEMAFESASSTLGAPWEMSAGESESSASVALCWAQTGRIPRRMVKAPERTDFVGNCMAVPPFNAFRRPGFIPYHTRARVAKNSPGRRLPRERGPSAFEFAGPFPHNGLRGALPPMRKTQRQKSIFPLRTLALVLALCVCPAAPGVRPASAITALEARNTAFKLQSDAMRLYKEGDYRKAIELLRQVTNISLNSFLANYYLGLALSADRQYAESLEPLKTALELEPGHIQAHIALGDANLKMGDLGEARAEYLRALGLQETYAPAHDGLGRLYEAEGDDDRAVAEYRKALEYNVAYPDAYASLGELYLRRGRLDDAIELFLKA